MPKKEYKYEQVPIKKANEIPAKKAMQSKLDISTKRLSDPISKKIATLKAKDWNASVYHEEKKIEAEG